MPNIDKKIDIDKAIINYMAGFMDGKGCLTHANIRKIQR